MSTSKEELLFLIGHRIRRERENSGISQEEIAKNIGVSTRTWGKYERGETVPDATVLAMLSGLYGFDTNFILTGRGSMPTNITQEEQTLIENYRNMNDAARLNMQTVSSAFAQSELTGKVKTK